MTTPAKKRVAKKVATKAPKSTPRDIDAPPSAEAPKSKNILTAGIKALTTVHEEAVARQSRVFESLLGLGKGLVPASDEGAAAALNPFGFKKFEDVFDQRVARAIQHLGLCTPADVARLEGEVAALREEVASLSARLAKR